MTLSNIITIGSLLIKVRPYLVKWLPHLSDSPLLYLRKALIEGSGLAAIVALLALICT